MSPQHRCSRCEAKNCVGQVIPHDCDETIKPPWMEPHWPIRGANPLPVWRQLTLAGFTQRVSLSPPLLLNLLGHHHHLLPYCRTMRQERMQSVAGVMTPT